MIPTHDDPPRRGPSLLRVLLILLAILPATWLARWRRDARSPPDPAADPGLAELRREASHEDVARACGSCHAYPSPDLFPRSDWPAEVERGFGFIGKAGGAIKPPPLARVIAYYQNRAPEALPELSQVGPASPSPVAFRRLEFGAEAGGRAPGIASVRFVRLSDDRGPEVLACDMFNGRVLLLDPNAHPPATRILSEAIPNPARAEVVDLDGDGRRDLLVADLGSPVPTERRLGRVVWLRSRRDGSFTPYPLARDLGRVADVRAADFDGDGDLDLVVAEFGRLAVGSILLLENRTTDYDRPAFARTTIHPLPGTIDTPVADLDGDGRPDFVALVSQEHETVVAFLNAGGNRFRPQVIFRAPHPAFGSSGIQLVDLDRDGDLDVLLTNGDSLDSQLLRPYHGIQWLENRGTYPFEPHRLASLYGCQRAVAADIDRDGDLDIVATCFLPGPYYAPLCRAKNLDSVVLLEQDGPGRFVLHPIEKATCDHASCDVGDFDGDGNPDLLIGNIFLPDPEAHGKGRPAPSIIIEKNLGRGR